MAEQTTAFTPLGKLISVVLILGLIGLGVYIVGGQVGWFGKAPRTVEKGGSLQL